MFGPILAGPLIVDCNEGVFDSLRPSKQIVTISGFGIYFLLVIIVTAISFAPAAIPCVGYIVAWFVTPIVWLVEAAAYVQAVDEKRPLK